MKNKKTKYGLYFLLAILGVAVVWFLFFRNKDKVISYETVKISRSDLKQTVSETGTVKQSDELALAFFSSGRVAKINKKIGDSVKRDEVLAELDYSDLLLKQREAQINISAQVSALNKLKSGATKDDINVSEKNLAQSQANLNSSRSDYEKTVRTLDETIAQAEKRVSDLYDSGQATVTTEEQAVSQAQVALANALEANTKARVDARARLFSGVEDKIASARVALDAVDRIISDQDIDLDLSVANPYFLAQTKGTYNSSLPLLSKVEQSLHSARSINDDNAAYSVSKEASVLLEKTFESLSFCFLSLEASVTSSNLPQSVLDAHKASIAGQKTQISAAISALQAAEQSLSSAVLAESSGAKAQEAALAQAKAAYASAQDAAKNALASAKLSREQQISAARARIESAQKSLDFASAQLEQVKSGANRFDIDAAASRVAQAVSAREQIDNQIKNSLIVSPVDGMVTKIDIDPGENFLSGTKAISVQAKGNMEVELLISESDIIKVQTNDQVDITLDAFGDDAHFEGRVFFIEPAATVVQEVVYYKIKASFDPGEREVKSGMTANAVITTEEKKGILTIPLRALVDKGKDGKFVKVLNGTEVLEKNINLGIIGDGGQAEVLSGLNEGEEIVLGEKK